MISSKEITRHLVMVGGVVKAVGEHSVDVEMFHGRWVYNALGSLGLEVPSPRSGEHILTLPRPGTMQELRDLAWAVGSCHFPQLIVLPIEAVDHRALRIDSLQWLLNSEWAWLGRMRQCARVVLLSEHPAAYNFVSISSNVILASECVAEDLHVPRPYLRGWLLCDSVDTVELAREERFVPIGYAHGNTQLKYDMLSRGAAVVFSDIDQVASLLPWPGAPT